jgi:hypothetical protein
MLDVRLSEVPSPVEHIRLTGVEVFIECSELEALQWLDVTSAQTSVSGHSSVLPLVRLQCLRHDSSCPEMLQSMHDIGNAQTPDIQTSACTDGATDLTPHGLEVEQYIPLLLGSELLFSC